MLRASCTSTLPVDGVSPKNHYTVAPPSQITLGSPPDILSSQPPLSNTSATTPNPASQSTPKPTSDSSATGAVMPVPNTDESEPLRDDAMRGRAKAAFDEAVKNSRAKAILEAREAHRRRNYASTSALTDYEADLTGKDRAKQKEAVKRYLGEKVKNDWSWEWPRPEPSPVGSVEPPVKQPEPEQSSEPPEAEVADEVDLLESNFVEDHSEHSQGEWKERDEWLSNASDEDDLKVPAPRNTASSHDTPTPTSKNSPTPPISVESVGETTNNAREERKCRRKKRLADELIWNDGLRCFVARRDNWTGARKVKRQSSAFPPAKKTPTRGSLSSADRLDSDAADLEDDDTLWEDDVEVPIAPPILPPENAMRASILPSAYNTIYDKVVVQALSPSCPMNLKDVTRSCVQGWKRDGEWPPEASVPDTLRKKARKLSVASILGLNERERAAASAPKEERDAKNRTHDKDDKDGKGGSIRNSLQKMLHLGKRGA
ncbi:uncharacterized protein L3040_006896 [Drepanopeziza brunnea f. sp. 'multigermtubi']|uniref:uncharacterized protein n=1 Tax=Drepanopeziza brunnea f. sp. 'multigermtubi' TaxID=698441 RepID=UPI0023834208|nr:hypothetical protein L3040_006896 [Drepanopeziza brunnea f. sp. 'multigermtubi']